MKKLIAIGVIVLIAILIFASVKGTYNTMIEKEERVNQQWAQVINVYQRRADLIPNMVNTVKGYADFEQETITQLTEARSKVNQINVSSDVVNDPQAIQKLEEGLNSMNSAFSRLMVVVENYPDLKAQENFRILMTELEGSENRISIERKKFNEEVGEYNTYIRKFPKNIYASMLGFEKLPYFEGEQGIQEAPEVTF